jgi:iron(III) transport system permease protein
MNEPELTRQGMFNGQRLNQIRERVKSPQFAVTILLLAVLSYLVLIPIFGMVDRTLMWEESDIRFSQEAEEGEYTLYHWKKVLFGRSARKIFIRPLINSIVTGSISAVIALLLGGILSWLLVRTNMPGRKWLRPVLTIPYIIPSFAIALAWTTLFRSPRAGGEAGLFESMIGISPPEWLSYGPVPMIITMVIHYFPFSLLLVSGALATIDTQMEESAEMQGASRWLILRKITFPLVTPAFLSAFVLTFGKTIGTFALPFLLGSPVGYHTLPTMLFSSLSLGMEASAYILAFVLILITALVVYVSSRISSKKAKRFETIGGKGFKGNPTNLGKWAWPISGLVTAFAFIAAFFPIGLLSYQSLMLIDGRFDLANLTSHYWIGQSVSEIAFGEPGVFHNPMILGATWNSIKLAGVSSVICAFIGLVIGYIIVRNRQSWLSTLLDQVSFIPFLFPSIAMGAMYLSMFATRNGPIPALYGTFTLLVIISVVKRLPYSVKTGTSAVTQIGVELEEAAEIQGATWLQRLWRIVAPLATSGVVAGLMVSFVGIMRELSLIILLITPETRVLMTLGFRYAEEDQVQLGNTLVLLVTFITITGELIIWRFGKGRLAKLSEKQMNLNTEQ